MTALEQQTGKHQIDELADRQLRYEQRYFDCLNEIFTRLEGISEQNESIQLYQEKCNPLHVSCVEELAALTETINALKLVHQAECNALNLSRVEELAALTETIRLRNLGIEQLQEELSQQSFLMVNAQAELAYLLSRHPKARAKRVIERFGFLITSLLPISWLRRGRRILMSQLKFMN